MLFVVAVRTKRDAVSLASQVLLTRPNGNFSRNEVGPLVCLSHGSTSDECVSFYFIGRLDQQGKTQHTFHYLLGLALWAVLVGWSHPVTPFPSSPGTSRERAVDEVPSGGFQTFSRAQQVRRLRNAKRRH